MSSPERTRDVAEIEAQLRASREALAADVDALAARFSPKEQAKQAGKRLGYRLRSALTSRRK
ncbi:Protein of uncharacterised function (DUF3618) [Actinomyces bovis]|uniref:Protein of uncharacterized function (DUF3618) n=1 Tax=Actinomyces bovis TaxID=1658 RepID=A0ABY1VN32_9ACTO|nr:DUF3618 domain-containing protein [Actinomyces bovis]SPT53521.1 Protein of uncharacterised function (DUF3618) [Actinomyces bovis]VEG55463.1 Protein of uncharacterised function (DUF3618) [Actinomyces israelii]